MRSDPSRVGDGRSEVESRGGADVVGSSKVNRARVGKEIESVSDTGGKSGGDVNDM
jgi:hypothetical protein